MSGMQTKAGRRKKMAGRRSSIAIVGAGSLAGSLAAALCSAGHTITEVIVRARPASLKRGRVLARKLGVRVTTAAEARLDANVLWFCVPDSEIRRAAREIAGRGKRAIRIALHSSGALGSRELKSLRRDGLAIGSAHPLMTFVPATRRSLAGVPFAVEGDPLAVREARRLVRNLGGDSFVLAARHKSAYHAWATMTSPLLVAYLAALEEAARAAGLNRREAQTKSLPILRQTLENYARLGSARSFSGPFVRGDAETVRKHMALLKSNSRLTNVYLALAREAIAALPVKNRSRLRRLLAG